MTPIRPAPVHAPRPTLFDDAVLRRAFDGRRADIEAWAAGLLLAPEQVEFAVMAGLKGGKLDGYRAARALDHAFGWRADQELVLLLRDVISNIPAALRMESRTWAVRSGYRVPAAVDDDIEWLSPSGEPRSGKVHHVDKDRGSVIVLMGGDPDCGVVVFGEQIVGNITQSRYGLEEPVLGATYAPEVIADAHAQALSDFEAATRAASAPQGAAASPHGARGGSKAQLYDIGVPDDFSPDVA